MTGPAEDDATAVRGRVPATPRWIPARDKNNEAARRMQAGDISGATALFDDVVASTRGCDDDGEALDLRARALLNLAAAVEWQAQYAEALALHDEGLAAAAAAFRLIGDERATRTVALNGRLSRTQVLLALDRAPEALAELDAVGAELATEPASADESLDQRELLTASLHNIRTGVLITLGRLHEAEESAHRAITAATSFAPQLAAHAYAGLAAIAQRTGGEFAEGYLQLAAALHGPGADVTSRQLVIENLARAALQEDRDDEAADLFTQAESMAREAGLAARAAACRMGIAAIELHRGRAGRAVKMLHGLVGELEGIGAGRELGEALGFLGDAQSVLGRHSEAHESYSRARDLARSVHDRCRIDLRRATAFAEWADETSDAAQRIDLLRTALTIAVPVHLATEALRDGFPMGAARERWAHLITAPSRALAFRLTMTMGEAQLLHDLIESAAASATLQSDSAIATTPVVPLFGALAGTVEPPLPVPDDDTGELPAAAAGLARESEGEPQLRFALPPRVQPYPGAPAALAVWIDRAESVYGITIRSPQTVGSW